MRSASPIAWTWAASSASARSRTRTGSTSAPRPEKWATPIAAQRSNAVLAVRPGGGRQDGDAGPGAAGRGEQARVELRSSRAGTRPIPRGRRLRACGVSIAAPVRHCRAMTRTERWTLLAAILGSGIVFLDGTIVNLALPSDRPACRPRSSASSRARPTSSAGYLAVLVGAADPRRRPGRLLRPAADLRDRPGSASASRRCSAGSPRTSSCSSSFRILQGASGALLVPGSLSIITATFDGPARSRAFGTVGGRRHPASPSSASRSAGSSSTRCRGGPRSSSTSRSSRSRCGRRSATCAESRDPDADAHVRLARGASSGRSRSAGWRSARPAASSASGRTALAWVVARRSAPSPSSSSRSSWSGRPHPLVPLELFRDPRVRGDQPLDVPDLRRPLRRRSSTSRSCSRARSATRATAVVARRACRPGSCSCRSRPGSARSPAASGAEPFLVAGPLIMAAGLLWWARIPATSTPWLAAFARTRHAGPADRRRDRRPAGAVPVRARDLARRRAPDEHADELDPDAQRGPRVGDQQRPVAGRTRRSSGR